MAEVNSYQSNKSKNSLSKPTSRRSTKVDLTPMVDLGFLLITFFVFTTSMSFSTAKDLIETKVAEPRPVKQSGAMTIILGENHEVYYYYGELDDKPLSVPKKSDFKSIRNLITKKKKETNLNDLMYIIKADKNSTFGDNINLLDEMSICNIPKEHYAEVEISEKEIGLINSKNKN